ncbi:hypothetical protein GCM10027277_54780 [Pseudoduganella ginsengisoli]|uniref:Uncharacterized protein n=1 Tax=Pseudoduganella ginsengisoli TaxID=1462440 RepID=A0A6L6Q4W6_9BURK|nr:hypothetical protein [Pseudoduganella ginsengisoli]MTW04913.1 hypothetical protein [Pseudoduganella ginsengisoli]
MREQNTVERVEVYDSINSEGDVRWAVEMLAASGVQAHSAAFEPVIQSAMNRIATGQQVLLVITHVYGATVLALAANVSI